MDPFVVSLKKYCLLMGPTVNGSYSLESQLSGHTRQQ